MNRNTKLASLFWRPVHAKPHHKNGTLTDPSQANPADESVRLQACEGEVPSDKFGSLLSRPSSESPKYEKEILKDTFQTIMGETLKLYQVWEEESNDTFEVSADECPSQQVWDGEFPNQEFALLLSPPKSDTPTYYKGMPIDRFQTMMGESTELHQIWEEESNSTFEVSLELSQHDPRREGYSTAESKVPRYTGVVPYRQIVKARMDAMEAGFGYIRNPRPPHVHPYRPCNVDSYSMSGPTHSIRTIKTNNLKSYSKGKRETSNNSTARQRKNFANRSVHSSALLQLPPCVPSTLKGTDYDTVQIIEESWRRELLSFPIHSCI